MVRLRFAILTLTLSFDNILVALLLQSAGGCGFLYLVKDIKASGGDWTAAAAGERWVAMTDEERRPYKERAAADMRRYEQDLASYNSSIAGTASSADRSDAHTHTHAWQQQQSTTSAGGSLLESPHDVGKNAARMRPTTTNQRDSPVNGTSVKDAQEMRSKAPRPPPGKFKTLALCHCL